MTLAQALDRIAVTPGWFIFLAALVVRVALVLPMPANSVRTPISSDFTMDARAYAGVARNLVDHGVFGYGARASAFRPPLYPAYLAVTFRLFGENYRVVRLGQALMGALACLALLQLGRRLFDRQAATFAALLLSVYPFTLYFTGEVMTETLFTWLMLGSVTAVVAAWQQPTWNRALIAGAALGAATLCRPTALAFAAFVGLVGLFLRWRSPQYRRGATQLVIAGLVAAVCVSPWIVRNSLLFGRLTNLTTYTGLNLYKGLPGKDDRSSMDDFGITQQMVEDAQVTQLPLAEPEMDRAMRRYWQKSVLDHPGAYLREKFGDLSRFWFDFRLAGNAATLGGIATYGAIGAYLAVLVAGTLGLLQLLRSGSWGALSVVLTVIVGTMLLYVPFFAGKRFRIATVDPMLILLAGHWLRERVAARWCPHWPPTVG